MNIEQALSKGLGVYYGYSGRADVPSMMAGLARVTGSKKAAAEAAGVGRSTWGFWDAGTRPPSRTNLAKLKAAYERLIARPRRREARKAKRLPTQAAIQADVVAHPDKARYRNSKPWRTFNAGKGKNLDLTRTVAAWVRGKPLAPEFLADVKDAYTEPFAFEGNDCTANFS